MAILKLLPKHFWGRMGISALPLLFFMVMAHAGATQDLDPAGNYVINDPSVYGGIEIAKRTDGKYVLNCLIQTWSPELQECKMHGFQGTDGRLSGQKISFVSHFYDCRFSFDFANPDAAKIVVEQGKLPWGPQFTYRRLR